MMTDAIAADLKKLESYAFYAADVMRDVLTHYHHAAPNFKGVTAKQLRSLYQWLFVPQTIWPFNIHQALGGCLRTVEIDGCLNPQQRLLVELLPEPPKESVCVRVAEHEVNIQNGFYENLVTTQSKFSQVEQELKDDSRLLDQWEAIKSEFDLTPYRDHKGVVRRTMGTERNLRPTFSVDVNSTQSVFRAAFDAFCLRWNLYGMQNDEPLLLKLAVNLTPFGTMIIIPSYWSFDKKRDVEWDEIIKLHGARVPKRQGPKLAQGVLERKKLAQKLVTLDQEVRAQGLKGAKKHEFLCNGLGLVLDTDPKVITRLRMEFKNGT